jgi:hypothetical protein
MLEGLSSEEWGFERGSVSLPRSRKYQLPR